MRNGGRRRSWRRISREMRVGIVRSVVQRLNSPDTAFAPQRRRCPCFWDHEADCTSQVLVRRRDASHACSLVGSYRTFRRTL